MSRMRYFVNFNSYVMLYYSSLTSSCEILDPDSDGSRLKSTAPKSPDPSGLEISISSRLRNSKPPYSIGSAQAARVATRLDFL